MDNSALDILNSVGAVITNSHVVYNHGGHGREYVNKDAVFPHTKTISVLCQRIAYTFRKYQVGVVIAPATAGIVLSQRVADHLTDYCGREVLSIYADQEDSSFAIRRGYDKLIPGKNVLVVEDVLKTGASAKKVVKLVRSLGGNIVGIGALCNCGDLIAEELGVPVVEALISFYTRTWSEKDCPMCKEGIPVNIDVGHGLDFMHAREIPT